MGQSSMLGSPKVIQKASTLRASCRFRWVVVNAQATTFCSNNYRTQNQKTHRAAR